MFKLNYVEKGDYKIRLEKKSGSQHHRMKLIVSFINHIKEEFDLQPEIYELEEMAIGVLFNNACVDLEHFLDEYGYLISEINKKNPICIQGQVEGLEEGKIETIIQESNILFKKYNTTGRNFDSFKSMYIKIYFSGNEECQFIMSMIKRMEYNTNYIVMERKWDKLECVNGLYEKSPLLYFRYINLSFLEEEETSFFDRMEALGINEIMILWEKYLEEKVVYEEFERVWELYKNGFDVSIFKWGIGLDRVIRKKEIHVNIESNNVWSVFDKNGNKIRMGYNSMLGAEKLLVKFLFPNK